MAEKIFFGNVKEMTNEYGTMYSIGISKDDLNKLVFNDKGWANVSLKKSSKGNWYMEIYNPQNQSNNESSNIQEEDEELPF
ncbi:hypothetical protein [Candidatus Absconditicoccus praedator]|uniref:hypothetical protein n=1 Tax=Candidatus Absconditicoccus praedator TaxID=2735562 RepID=UPI001E5C5DE1|nr:hypothetical protein [Candidatus Absconditicoccus praedator]UFX83237.1 hypothetical protein HLG78_03860 [Candidatus Absconditicoccus praedator]